MYLKRDLLQGDTKKCHISLLTLEGFYNRYGVCRLRNEAMSNMG